MSAVKTLFHVVTDVLSFLLSLLPDDPFIDMLETSFGNYQGWIKYFNYFVPVAAFKNILSVWLACVVGLYLYNVSKLVLLKK